MEESDIENLAAKNYPSNWRKIIRFLCQRKHHVLIANISTKYLDVDFCNDTILKQLHSKSEWMKGLLKKLSINQIRREKDIVKKGKSMNIETDMEKQHDKQKANTIGVHKGMNSKEEIDEYTYWTSLPKTYETGQEDSLRFKQGIKMINERMNALPTEREKMVQLNDDSQERKAENLEGLNADTGIKKKGYKDDRAKDKKLSNGKVILERDDVTSQKMDSNCLKDEDIQERNEITNNSKKQANVTYSPSVANSVLNSTDTEENKSLQEKNHNIISICMNSMQAKFPVLSNTTTILREAAVIQKNEERQLRILQDLSEGGGDPLMWRKLQEESREKEKIKRKESMEMKRLQALLWQEEAILAKRNVLQKNKLEALKLKNEKSNIINMRRKLKEKEEQLKKSLIQNTQMTAANAQKAVQKSMKAKKMIAKKMQEERRILQEAIAQKKKEEEAEKTELKKKIKELCKPSSFPFKKSIDLTETPGWGFSCEMSIAELQERLRLQKLHDEQEIEERKREARRQQQQKQEYLEDIDKFLREYKQSRKNVSQPIYDIQETQYPESRKIIELKKLLEEKRAQKLLGNKSTIYLSLQ